MADWENVGQIQGPKGDKGDKGDTGERGPKGEDGKSFDDINAEWHTLPLENGVEEYTTTDKPVYCKVAGIVYIKGAVKGITEDNTILSNLPAGYRPNRVYQFIQPVSAISGVAHFANHQINTAGQLRFNFNSRDDHPSSMFYSLCISFPVF